MEELQQGWTKLSASERLLPTAIPGVLDIGAHVLAALGDDQWEGYRAPPAGFLHLR